MRKKLTELANDVLKHLPWGQVSSHTAEELADYLIANGVTFADVPDTNVGKWIPVSEQPKKNDSYLVLHKYILDDRPPAFLVDIADFALCLSAISEDFKGKDYAGWYKSDIDYGEYEWGGVAYWMPLPKLPGEE